VQIVDHHGVVMGSGSMRSHVGMTARQICMQVRNVVFEFGGPKPECRDKAKGCDARQDQERGVQPECRPRPSGERIGQQPARM